MIENYVHWNEDIGEWQLVSITLILSWEYFLWSRYCAGYNGEERGPVDESDENPVGQIKYFSNSV